MNKINSKKNKLIIGTAQFGSKYGITNKNFTNQNESNQILNFCFKNNIREIDTAISYKGSEKILGNIGVKKFILSTKLPKIPNDKKIIKKWIDQELENSFNRLKLESIDILYLHNPADLLSKNKFLIYEILQDLKASKLIKSIGVSVYSPQELMRILDLFQIDAVQFPFNVMDTRFANKKVLSRLQDRSIKIYLRSIFLQGLLITPQSKHPKYFYKWSNYFKEWEIWLKEQNISPIEGCLSHAISMFEDSKIIIGVSSLANLKEIIKALDKEVPAVLKEIQSKDLKLIDPRNWRNSA